MTPERDPWRKLRATRADRPKYAQTASARKRTYGTALEQAEQLWLASEDVGPVASPILLYYAFAQAVRACLAGIMPSDEWRGDPGHGLSLVEPPGFQSGQPRLSDVKLRSLGSGLVPHIATALESRALTGGATLAALIASEAAAGQLSGEDVLPPILRAIVRSGEEGQFSGYGTSANDCVLLLRGLPSTILADVAAQSPPHTPLRELLCAFPHLGQPGDSWFFGEGSAGPLYHVVFRGVTPAAMTERIRSPGNDEPLNRYGLAGDEYSVAPCVAGNDEPLHPVVAQLSIAWTMSMLARYYPELWSAMIDLDTNPDAARIRDVLEATRSTFPYLVLNLIEQFAAENP